MGSEIKIMFINKPQRFSLSGCNVNSFHYLSQMLELKYHGIRIIYRITSYTIVYRVYNVTLLLTNSLIIVITDQSSSLISSLSLSFFVSFLVIEIFLFV